ncbi:MAG: hypothetical protein WC551_11225 [Patescibacteria group bacterium]
MAYNYITSRYLPGTLEGGSQTPPDAPALSVADNTDGSVTAAVTGTGTIRLYYRLSGIAAWTAGSSRSGDGDITQSGLTQGKWYDFYATADNGLTGAPSTLARVLVTDVAQHGILIDIEDAAIAVLTALSDDDGNPLFKNISDTNGTFVQVDGQARCIDHWLGQIGIGNSGIESFDRFAPFAFVQAEPRRVKREGGHDANIRIELSILFGQSSLEPYICRLGDATHVGTSRMMEKIFLAFDNWHPGSGIVCDEFYLADIVENCGQPKKHGLQMIFEANWIPLTS